MNIWYVYTHYNAIHSICANGLPISTNNDAYCNYSLPLSLPPSLPLFLRNPYVHVSAKLKQSSLWHSIHYMRQLVYCTRSALLSAHASRIVATPNVQLPQSIIVQLPSSGV